jgi:hypothetical protein
MAWSITASFWRSVSAPRRSSIESPPDGCTPFGEASDASAPCSTATPSASPTPSSSGSSARSPGPPAFPPETKVFVNEFEVDFYWPDLRLVVETDSLRFHRTAQKQSRDLLRDQVHTAAASRPCVSPTGRSPANLVTSSTSSCRF